MGDVIARLQRLATRTSSSPMGFDAFGMPAEERGEMPAAGTQGLDLYPKPSTRWCSQMKPLGFGLDWSRNVRHLQIRSIDGQAAGAVRSTFSKRAWSTAKEALCELGSVDMTVGWANEQ